MKKPSHPLRPPHLNGRTAKAGFAARQRGVVLIISLIMLMVISLLATFSIRNAASSETVAGNARTTMLATQASEMALRYCETALALDRAGTPIAGFEILPAQAAPTPPLWTSVANWDQVTTDVNVVPISVVNQAGGSATYSRAPECMVENVRVPNGAGTAYVTTSTFVITARGFGPEVAADAARGRPIGSEVWMQSTVELQ